MSAKMKVPSTSITLDRICIPVAKTCTKNMLSTVFDPFNHSLTTFIFYSISLSLFELSLSRERKESIKKCGQKRVLFGLAQESGTEVCVISD